MSNTEATKFYSNKQESNLAYLLGWEVVPGSGARPTVPGDIISDDWLGECKTHTTKGQSISFVPDVWKKLCDEAMMKHRKPALFVDDGSQSEKFTWAMCYQASIDVRNALIVDINQFKKMRTNITFKDSAMKEFLANFIKNLPEDIGTTYEYTFITTNLHGVDVLVMPFEVFKEIYNK